MSHVDQRIAAVSHLSIGFGVIVGVGFMLGVVINLVIWLRSRRSSIVELHSEQAGTYQLAVLVTNLVIVGIWIGVVIMLMGDSEIGAGQLSIRQILMGMWCALLPLQVAWYFGTIVYGLYAGLVVASGRDFSYPIIGPWVRRRIAAREARSAPGPN
jgi:uncharacterized Tic20 family protein